MSVPSIRRAGPGDAGSVAWMLRQLAEGLGDGADFATTEETIRHHGYGPQAAFDTIIADTADKPLGMALFFRHFSTTRGQAGVYVQDLWIAPEARGAGLGPQLLAAVARHAATGWGAEYIALTVHASNAGADRFYDRLGFVAYPDAKLRILPAAGIAALTEAVGPN
jgi:GNAT superfamily N-acetyltransferase